MFSGARRDRFAAFVAACVCLTAAACTSKGAQPPAGAPRSIEVHGQRLDFAGLVPWANPVTDPTDPKAVYVSADNDRTDLTIPACGIAADRTVVHESPASVSVTVVGYAGRVPAGAGCALVGHAPVRVKVELRRPLGDRALIDNRGRVHKVLEVTTVPAPTNVDPSCVAPPLSWNERTGFVQRTWGGPRGRCPMSLQYGPTDVIDGTNLGRPVHTININGVTGRVWKYQRADLTIRWSPTPGHEVQLSASGLSSTQLIALARSTR